MNKENLTNIQLHSAGATDLVLICGKSYNGFLFLREEISVRVEFSNGSIQSMQRKRDIMKDND